MRCSRGASRPRGLSGPSPQGRVGTARHCDSNASPQGLPDPLGGSSVTALSVQVQWSRLGEFFSHCGSQDSDPALPAASTFPSSLLHRAAMKLAEETPGPDPWDSLPVSKLCHLLPPLWHHRAPWAIERELIPGAGQGRRPCEAVGIWAYLEMR